MTWMDEIGGILNKYSNPTNAPKVDQEEVNQHFDSVANSVPPNILAQGVLAALSSGQGGSFGSMVGDLFNRSSPEQKTGLLAHLISSLGPSAAAILASKGLSGLAGTSGNIDPQAASQVSPATVSEIANQAQKQNPSIVDAISGFYAQHPALVKTLGIAALSMIMSRMSHRAA
jgi:hypothetical protein